MKDEQLPPGFLISKDLMARSRWVVSYKGDPFFFVKKVNALGEERIQTFATKRAARQAVDDHEKWVASLELGGR